MVTFRNTKNKWGRKMRERKKWRDREKEIDERNREIDRE